MGKPDASVTWERGRQVLRRACRILMVAPLIEGAWFLYNAFGAATGLSGVLPFVLSFGYPERAAPAFGIMGALFAAFAVWGWRYLGSHPNRQDEVGQKDERNLAILRHAGSVAFGTTFAALFLAFGALAVDSLGNGASTGAVLLAFGCVLVVAAGSFFGAVAYYDRRM